MAVYSIPFVIVLLATPVLRRIALARGITDDARGDPLKIHKEPVPLLGGLAVLAGVGGGLAVSGPLVSSAGLRFLIGGLLVFGVGLWDDVKGVKPSIRLAVHLLAGIIVLLSGVRMEIVPVRGIAAVLTLFYITGAINAFNITDGMDGLCTGMSIISCIGFFCLGLMRGDPLLTLPAALLCMSLLGFLPYNFHPARIFLGDAGSGFLGFMLGVMAIAATKGPCTAVRFAAPIGIIGIPVCDMAFAVVRRIKRGKSLVAGDRDHLYDMLLKKGLSQPKVWWLLCATQAAMVAVALYLLR